MTRYLSGLCVAGRGLCGGGWLIVTAAAFGGEDGSAGRVNLATGAGLVLASCVAAVAWAVAWRRRLRTDGVLADRFLLVSRREARRNRRELARDVRRTARRSRREARRDWDAGERGSEMNGHALNGAEVSGTGPDPYAHGSFPAVGYHGVGHDGASAAEVLGELRTLRGLLGPLLATAGSSLAASAPPPAATPPAARARGPEPPAGGPEPSGGDDEVRRLADGEDAWW
jgi:hypothetical protein